VALEYSFTKNSEGLLAALVLVTALHSPIPRSRFLRVYMVLIGATGLVLSRSLGSIAATAAALAFFGLTSARSRVRRQTAPLLTLPRLLAIAAIGLMLATILRPENITTSKNFNTSTTVHREVLAVAGLDLFQEHPVVGIGWSRAPTEIGSVKIDQNLRKRFGASVRPEFLPRKNPTSVHNTYIEILAEAGIVGAVLFLFFAVALVRGIRDVLRSLATSSLAYQYARCAAAIVLLVAVWLNDNALFGSQPETVMIAAMIGILAAIPAAQWAPTPRAVTAPSRPV
jgi:O-antigen ligase